MQPKYVYTWCVHIRIPEVPPSLYMTHRFVRFPECLNIITHGGEKKKSQQINVERVAKW